MNLHLVLVPYDTARRSWRSGAGPEHLRDAGLIARLKACGHTVTAVQVIEVAPDSPPAEIATAFELIRKVAGAVRAARGAGRFPVVLSGNCNIAVGSLSGLTPARRAVFWFDAHADCNTPETTTSGFADGTGLAAALGMCWRGLCATVPGFEPVRPEDTLLVGVRDVDPPEAALLKESAIRIVTGFAVTGQLRGLLNAGISEELLGYVHVDLDVFDPGSVGRANALPVPGGLSVEQVTQTIRSIRAEVPLGAVALASYAPEYDVTGAVSRGAFAVLEAALGSVEKTQC